MRLAVKETETDNLFETLANKSPVGLYIVQDGKFCYTNPAFQNTTGYTEDELVGRDALDLVAPEDREKVRENAIKTLKGELTLPYQVRVTHQNGSRRWVTESVAPIQYRGRQATLGYFVDITERKQVEEALQASEEMYKTVVEDAPIGIYYNDFNGTFLYGNKRAEEIVGYKVEELLGKSFLKLKLLRPEEIGKAAKLLALNKLGKATGPDRFTLNRKDGSTRIVEIRTNVITLGGKKAVLGMVEDITKRKQAEEKLREGEERYKTIFKNVSEAIIRVDRYGKILDVNERAEEYFGYKPEEIIGKNFAKTGILSLKDLPKMIKLFGETLRGKHAPIVLELEAKRKDGSPVLVEVNPKLVKKNGKAEGCVAIIRDITERKQAEMRIQESESRYRLVAENVADVIWTVDIACPTRLTYISPSVTRLLGYSVEESMAKEMESIFTPASFNVAMKAFAEEMAYEQKEHVNQHQSRKLELQLSHKNGSLVDVEVNFSFIRGVDGHKDGILAVARDITERKQVEEAIQAEKNKLQSLIDALEYTITIQDTEYNITYQNEPSRIAFGDHLGEKCYRVYEGRETICENCPLEKTFRDAKPYTSERQRVLPSGEVTFWEHTANPIRDARGRVVSSLALGRNITERKRAEEVLNKTRGQLSSAVQIAHLGPWEYDAINDLFIFNDAFYEMFHTTAEEVGGYTMSSAEYARRFVHPKDAHLVGEEVRKALQADDPNFSRQVDHRIIYGDGGVGYISVHFFVVKDETGRTVRTYGVNQDITEHKRAEEALQAEKNKLQSLIDAMEDTITIQDTEYNIIYQNGPSRIASGGDHLGEKCYRVYEGRQNICEGCPVEKAFKDGKSHTSERMTTIAGKIAFWENTANPIRDAGGRIVSCIEIARDITERKEQEQALADELAQHHLLIDRSLDGIVVLDVDAKVVEANQRFADMLGYTLEEIYELHTWDWDKIFPPEQILEMGRNVDEKGLHLETKHTCKDGSVIDVDISISGIIYGGRKLIFCIQRDVTERKKAEEALKNSEESYRELANSITDIFFAMDEHLRYTYWNKASEILTGTRAEDAIGKSLLEIFPDSPGTRKAGKVYRAVLRTQQSQNFVNEFDINGRRYIFEISAYPSRDGISVFARDITGRKEMEEAINLQTAYFQQLFDNSPDAIIMTDTNSKVIQTNRGFEVLFGYSNEEAKGRSLSELILPGVDVQEASDSFQRISVGEIIRKESVRRCKDGSLVNVSVLGYPIRSNDKLVGVYGVYSDITERNRAEEAIKRAAEEWRETFDSITDAISIHDRDFNILRANKAFADIFHKKPSQIIGKHCYELHKANKPKSGCPHKQTLATKKPAAAEFYESNLGKYLHESTSPIFDDKGEVVSTVHITRDVTEQKQQHERLMMADRLASIGELAAGTAHELNNPLTSVIGFSQLLMEKNIPDDIREDAELIYNEAQRAANVTKNLLTFGRKHAPVKQLNQINNIIEDVLKLRAYEHKVNGIEVKRQFTPDLPEIMVDYFQMQQVFLNIIINAEYFMTQAHNKGVLTITTEKQNSSVKISIADDGPGIPEENLSRIFNPFFTTKEAGKGTGLGLSICHGIVAEHGGQISAKNRHGKGAIIIIELPISSH